MSDNDPRSLLSAYDGFLQMFYINLETVEKEHFKFAYGEQAQKFALEHVNKQIGILKEESQKVRKMVDLLYG